jgi:glutamate synthase domain-containing protein 1
LKIYPRISEACGIFGTVNVKGNLISGETAVTAMEAMRPRYNGLGAGFAGYGIYPKYKDLYALHILFDDENSKRKTEGYLNSRVEILKDEPIPTRKVGEIRNKPILWRYFVNPAILKNAAVEIKLPDDQIVDLVTYVNSEIEGAHIVSSGKDMGIFKAVGYPWEVAELYGIDEYKAYMWIAHGRYPTNTPGWWGGAHPFNILGWSVVHNGEISSYDTNKRYVEQWGYRCTLQTDSEVLAYLFDLLTRKHGLPLEVACTAITPPFWKDIDNPTNEQGQLLMAIRITYNAALVNGPFSIIVGVNQGIKGMIGLTDRVKLRPLVAAKNGDVTYLASEECAIRAVCPEPEIVWTPKASTPVIAKVEAAS